MSFLVNIHSQLDTGTILLSEATLEKAKLKANVVTLHFGEMTKELTIKIDNELNLDTLTIPQNVTSEISIPNLPYEVKLEDSHLHIGPVIGFIPEKVFFRNPQIFITRFSKYSEINGLIFIFRPNGINRLNKTIKGYYFDPTSKEFVRGIFPYPKAVFSRDYLSKTTFSNFKGKLYNYPYNLDKKKFWSIMSKDKILRKHIPETKGFKDLESVLQMVNKHNAVYLKPYNLSQGRGIYHLRKDAGGGFLLTDISSNHYRIKSEEELMNILRKKLEGTYLLQQEITSIFDNRKIDFRAYFHKNQNKEWCFTGTKTKISIEGSIISNLRNREQLILGETALSTLFHLDDKKIEEINDEIIRTCIRALKLVEKSGYHLGEAAVDFVIDKQLSLWLLEIQVNYASEKLLKLPSEDQLLLADVLPASFNYAKALAGFGETNNY
jgi:hypothetical protein